MSRASDKNVCHCWENIEKEIEWHGMKKKNEEYKDWSIMKRYVNSKDSQEMRWQNLNIWFSRNVCVLVQVFHQSNITEEFRSISRFRALKCMLYKYMKKERKHHYHQPPITTIKIARSDLLCLIKNYTRSWVTYSLA